MARRVVLFFALYIAVALIFSIRVPVVVTGAVYENGARSGILKRTTGYAYTLIHNWMQPPVPSTPDTDLGVRIASPNSPQQAPAGDGPWNDYALAAPAPKSAASSVGGFRPAHPLPVSPAPVVASPDADFGSRPAYPITSASAASAGSHSTGNAEPAPEPALDTGRYLTRLGVLLAALGTIWFGVIPYYAKIRRCVWFLPLFVYLFAAIWRLLYVPCTWTDHFRYRDVDHASTIALWNVGTESIRYGLLFFEELVLLAVAAACYGLAFAVIKHLRPGKRIFPLPG
jgi:hypothetical protein